MAIPRPPEKAMFFTGILAASRELLAPASAALEAAFGPSWCGSGVFAFRNTAYYLDELGPNPVRAFLAWREPYSTDAVARAKLTTNRIEAELARDSGLDLPRPVNLDPGYLTLAKVVLASAKNYAHRIHLHDNIYAEVTLQYRQGRFHTLPWTFPDYGSGGYDGFFLGVRGELAGR